MRIRSIKPEFWRSDDIAALPISARLLFVGLWSYVDDNGVGSDKLAAIAADLFAPDLEADPTETFRRVSVDTTRLEKQGLIVRYQGAGKPLLFITNWEKHQLVKNPSLGHKYPLPPAELVDAANVLRRLSVDPTESLGTGTGEQGDRGTGEQGPLAQPPVGHLFDEVWTSWPKKNDKKDALKKWPIAIRESGMAERELANIAIEHANAYRAHKSKQFTPAFVVWLNKARWDNEIPTGDKATTDAWAAHLQKLGGARGEMEQ